LSLEEFSLFESRSGRRGVVYEPLVNWRLARH
jgi:hypothetical protein